MVIARGNRIIFLIEINLQIIVSLIDLSIRNMENREVSDIAIERLVLF